MDSAEGIEVNNTVIKVLSIDVGRVTRIKLRDDQKGVEVTAQLNADVSGLIRSDTQFWVVKPRIDQSGVTGLGTLLSGSYIAFTPGKSDEAKDVFQVQDIPPVTAIGQSGLRLNLIGKTTASSTSTALFCMKTLWSGKSKARISTRPTKACITPSSSKAPTTN